MGTTRSKHQESEGLVKEEAIQMTDNGGDVAFQDRNGGSVDLNTSVRDNHNIVEKDAESESENKKKIEIVKLDGDIEFHGITRETKARFILLKEDELEEATTTASVDGYNTPFAFTGNKGKKKKKKISTNSTGYKMVSESLDRKDLEVIRKIIRDVIADVYRDIWIKRTSWK